MRTVATASGEGREILPATHALRAPDVVRAGAIPVGLRKSGRAKCRILVRRGVIAATLVSGKGGADQRHHDRQQQNESLHSRTSFVLSDHALCRGYCVFGQVSRPTIEYMENLSTWLDKNKRSTSVDTLDENTEKLKRTFVEKYRKAG